MKIRNSTGIQDIPHLLLWQVPLLSTHNPFSAKKQSPSIVHISTGQHPVAIQQLNSRILHGHYLSVSFLVHLQHDPFSQNRADDKEQRHQAQHQHNIPMEFPISVEGSRGITFATCLSQQPNWDEEL